MEKQTFDTRKMIGILLVSIFLVSITGASASAKNNTANYTSLCSDPTCAGNVIGSAKLRDTKTDINIANYTRLCNNPACGGNVIVSDDINIANSTRLCNDLGCVGGGIGSDKLQDTKADIRTF